MNNLQPVEHTTYCRYSEGGFVTLGFLIQLTNAVFPSLAFLMRMDDVLNLHFLSRMACTQKYVDQFTLPPEFRMNLRMGQAITTVGLAILYAPILPISALIGLLGILVQYAVDQYMALRHSSRPRAFQVEAFSGANYLLRLLPLIQLLLVLFFYFGYRARYASIVGLVIWATACVVPLMTHLRQREYTKWVEGGRPRCYPAVSLSSYGHLHCCLGKIPPKGSPRKRQLSVNQLLV